MCSAPKAPKMKDPEPLPQLEPLPPIDQASMQASMPIQRQAAAAAPVAQAPAPVAMQAPPPPTPLAPIAETPPPPTAVNANSAEDTPIVKKRKSKRKELQQASSGTDALRIRPNKLGATPSEGTGSSGLNIPK